MEGFVVFQQTPFPYLQTIKTWWCPKYVDELFTNLDSAGLSQKDINTFMTLPKTFYEPMQDCRDENICLCKTCTRFRSKYCPKGQQTYR
ncbi:hypothetical protein MTBBW1_340013 [Desulfamplus magnetovallimortis]|uniref:Uncharacterized protein n=1 Tax=Desulfamplus magnetovallimortis TaxID=1246637 RepID=A0A1W1HG27_9BACT|nr:hypothetical protein MTBBW1_340013 [Desulfamplus magnetovallimortis]